MADKRQGDKMVDTTKGDTMTDVVPLKDYVLHSPPRVTEQKLEKGVSVSVRTDLLDALKTEKVI